jgi:signal transduction histidine kinase
MREPGWCWRSATTAAAAPTRAAGSGLAGLADRVAAVDGALTLTSPSGGPTLIRAELPCG